MKKHNSVLKSVRIVMAAIFCCAFIFSTIGCGTPDDITIINNDSENEIPPVITPPTGGTGESDLELSQVSSIEFARRMTVGWNLGNTLDAHDSGAGKTNKGLSTETSWGMPTTTKAMIDEVCRKGFKTIRIPVSWHNHIVADNGEYKIDSNWMNRVKTVVQWAYDDGMFIILNVHHDDLTRTEMNSMYGYCVDTDTALQTKSKAYLSKVWEQIAKEFASYDEHLVFEVLNEPRYRDGENNGFATPSNLSDYNVIIKDYELTCINAIRANEGNIKHFIMVPYYAANPYNKAGWTVPADSVTGKILISTHAYNPFVFAMNDGNDQVKHTEFTSADDGDLDYLFNTLLKNTWIKNGYGVVMGEASASDKKNDAERLKWIESYYSKAKANSVPVILWDNMCIYETHETDGKMNYSECHGWFNRNNLTWFFPTLVEKMITTAGSSAGSPTGGDTTPVTLWSGSSELAYSKGDNNGVAIGKDLIAASARGFRFTYSSVADGGHVRIMSQKDWKDRVISSVDSGELVCPADSTEKSMVKLDSTKTTVTLYFSSTVMSDYATNGIKFYGEGVTITKVELIK